MKIGLLSDTHSFLDERVAEYFAMCDEIWHAGDIGDLPVATALEAEKPLRAVFGNIDGREIQNRFPEDLMFDCEGLKIFMTHIGGSPPNYNSRVKKIFASDKPDIFICGHSHILKAQRDPAFNNMLYLNPGAAGNHGFHTMKTMMRLEIKDGALKSLEVIELGKRGALPKTGMTGQ